MPKKKAARKSAVKEKKLGGFTQFQLIVICAVFIVFVLFFLL
jgi:hypothetical protein